MHPGWIRWRFVVPVCWAGFLAGLSCFAQQPCASGTRVDGTVTDPTNAVIPGAKVSTPGTAVTSDANGRYTLGCVAAGAVVTVRANGFADGTTSTPASSAGSAHLDIHLAVAAVQTDVQVNGDSDGDAGAETTTLTTSQVQALADDPDDFLRQLQVLA